MPLQVAHNIVLKQGRGFVIGVTFGLLFRSLRCRGLVCREHRLFGKVIFWQRNFFLVNCSQLRRLLASVRSGVVKTFP